MKKSIFVTGVAGSGKSTISRYLNSMGYKAYDIEDLEGLFCMFDKDTGLPVKENHNNDLEKVKRGEWNCDVGKLETIIKNEKSDIAFYCGTGSNLDDIIPLFDLVILLKASPEVIRERLSSRKRNSFAGTKEVQDWVIGWKDGWENWMQSKKGMIAVDANEPLEKTAKKIKQVVNENLKSH